MNIELKEVYLDDKTTLLKIDGNNVYEFVQRKNDKSATILRGFVKINDYSVEEWSNAFKKFNSSD